jgi:hypothetical protein
MNKPEQWCLIQALGRFDHRKGGHLWLPDCKLLIEFPAGSLIMLPSAVLRHGNIALADKSETRYSFVQYIAGSLFRWVDYKYRAMNVVEASDAPEDVELVRQMRLKAMGEQAVMDALSKWPSVASMQQTLLSHVS